MGDDGITWGRMLRVWWLIFWRAAVGGTLLSALAGFLTGFVMGGLGIPSEQYMGFLVSVSIAISLLWGIVVVRSALRKTYRGFRLAIVEDR